MYTVLKYIFAQFKFKYICTHAVRGESNIPGVDSSHSTCIYILCIYSGMFAFKNVHDCTCTYRIVENEALQHVEKWLTIDISI